ncbi:FAD-dependent monooxygenase [Myxosarcina sp. GI1]|uniref:FAD-dependent monooxygenase n=1 Tax=Myxosarcina sp. GI1 TaxID=1541065 RepID=UPI000566EF3A|nr:FAD-dependent monooxygenase [Myxosarcina sp. GI1]
MTQVAIIGAGPTGATLALLLVRQGITVKLIEAARDFRRVFRGEALMPSGLDALEQMGLTELLAEVPQTALSGWEFFLNERPLFRVAEPMFGDKPCTLVSQPHLLEAIVKQCQAYPEFELSLSTPVRDFLKEGDRVTGVRLADGTKITADVIIAADGRNSIMRQRAGLELKTQAHSINLLWFELEAGSLFEKENTFCSILQDRDGFGCFRSSQGKLQIGWGLHPEDDLDLDWKQIDWQQMLVANSPPWLAKHLQIYGNTISNPILLSVIVGFCPRWYIPGLLLVGDAVHPMSPIRAQGINMALRDVIVAANYLIPLLQAKVDRQKIDTVLPNIQSDRQPEIIKIQQLQDRELLQAKILRSSSLIRWGVKQFISLLRPAIRYSWLRRQKQLRHGVTTVRLASDAQEMY